MKTSERLRFLSKVGFGMSDCWLWKGFTDKFGYGVFRNKKITERAHRSSYRIFVGKFSKEMHVLHTCDVRNCVNPDHLFLGTHKDNMRDMISKNRHRFPGKMLGEVNPMSKLRDKDIIEIRKIRSKGELSCKKIGELYGVSGSTIDRIIKKESWSHI